MNYARMRITFKYPSISTNKFVSFMPQVMAATLLALVCGVLYAMEVQCSEGSYILVEVSSSDSEVLAGAGQALDCSGEDDVELVVVTPVCSATCSSSVVMASLTSPHLVWDGNSSLLGVVSMSGGLPCFLVLVFL